MFSIVYVIKLLRPQLHNDVAWRQHDCEWFLGRWCTIHSIKPRTVHLVFVAESRFSAIQDRSIDLPILLDMVRHDRCFTVGNLRLVQCVVWQCHAERYHQ